MATFLYNHNELLRPATQLQLQTFPNSQFSQAVDPISKEIARNEQSVGGESHRAVGQTGMQCVGEGGI
jgi:hypothetical protein